MKIKERVIHRLGGVTLPEAAEAINDAMPTAVAIGKLLSGLPGCPMRVDHSQMELTAEQWIEAVQSFRMVYGSKVAIHDYRRIHINPLTEGRA